MDKFADIRPYADSEVAGVIQRLLGDTEMLGAIAALQIPRWSAVFPKLLIPLLCQRMRRALHKVQGVRYRQMFVRPYMVPMVGSSTRESTGGCRD